MNTKKHKHLTPEDRERIQDFLNLGMTFKAIADEIEKDQTTISKEVKKHLDIRETDVIRTDAEGNPIPAEACPLLLKAPFVCNPCKKKHFRCKYTKQFYHATMAQRAYKELLSEAREGIPLNKEEFYRIDQIITEGVRKGQHLYHILQTHNLGVSKSTVYRHLKRGYLTVSAMDFPRVVKFKPRKEAYSVYVPKAARVGRTFDDFLTHIEENGITAWVEMDTVIGEVGGKIILTLYFTICNFMVGILLPGKTASQAAEAISKLKKELALAGYSFGELIPVALTDNGGEFAHVAAFELNLQGEKETHLFFCDPNRPYQKPGVEKNHTLFRDIVPKGSSFDGFTQDTVNLIFSHVNSVKRRSLGGKSPFEMFCFLYGEELANILGIRSVPAKDVIQSPKLLK